MGEANDMTPQQKREKIDFIIAMRFHDATDGSTTAPQRWKSRNYRSHAISELLDIDPEDSWKAVLHCKTEAELREFLETEVAIANVRG